MSTLHIHLLGHFHLYYNGELINSLNQARQQSLLAYLLLHPHVPHARQHLAFLIWPDSSEAQAHNNLRKALHHLRQALPDADRLLQIDGKTVRWRPDAAVVLDVAGFEQQLTEVERVEQPGQLARLRLCLEKAVEHYTGDLLPGCYDDWILPERERLREQLIDAMLRLIELTEQTREYAAAIRYANRLLRTDPLHEETYRRLMRLHALNGDRASALRVYHTCATTLQRELGVEPAEQTHTLYAQLLQLQTAPELPTRHTGQPARRDQLVGRLPEWRQLLAAWHGAAQGHAQLFVLAGEAGIGKTRLAEELYHSVSQQGMMAVRTRAYAAEGALAYAPVTEWLRAESLRQGWLRLDAVWLTELARLLPELLAERPDLPRPQPLTEGWQRQRLFETLARAVLAHNQALLLVLDDLQWCDRETLEWLHYLLRYDPKAPLLIVGTVRPEEVSEEHPLTTLLLDLRRAGQVTEIELGPLNAAETATLATQVAGQAVDAETAQRLYQATEGNPLFVVEMVQAREQRLETRDPETSPSPQASISSLQSPVSNLQSLPPKVHAVIQRRLSQLSPAARECASLAATIGRAFTFEVLVTASGQAEDTLAQSLDELWRRRIIREQGTTTYDFSHDRIREVAYGEISPIRRRQLHRRVGQALESLFATNIDDISAQLATHFEQAGMIEQAVGYYQRAAAIAERVFAYQDVIVFLNRALRLLQTQSATPTATTRELDIQMALGAAWSSIKSCAAPEVEQAYQRVLALNRQEQPSPHLFTALWGLHQVHVYRSQYARGLATAEECLRIAEAAQDPALLLEARHALWSTLFYSGDFTGALAHTPHGRSLYHPEHHQALAYHFGAHDAGHCGLVTSSAAHCFLGRITAAQQDLQASIELIKVLTLPVSIADGYSYTAQGFQLLRDYRATYTWAERALALSAKHGYLYYRVQGLILSGWAIAMQGDVRTGIARMEEAIAARSESGSTIHGVHYLTLLAEAYRAAGQIQAGLETLAKGLAVVQTHEERYYDAELHRLWGELLLASGADGDRVEYACQQAIAIARKQGAKLLELRAVMSLARLWQTQDRAMEAHKMLAEIYGWFTEGFDTADLQAAKALLDQLNPM